MSQIRVRGARTHNLKNIDVDLPRDKLVVITGLSGSGKSSLAFDTIYAEGQRRYVESLSAYARQFLSLMEKPDVDLIEGLSPAISIEQKSASHNPRSTVGTVTEVYDYLRLMFARIGEPRCPEHGSVLNAQTVSQMVDHTMSLDEGTRILMLARVVDGRKGEFSNLIEDLKRRGFLRIRVDGHVLELEEVERLDRQKVHTVDVVVDRAVIRPGNEQRLAESFETALELSEGTARIAPMPDSSDPTTDKKKKKSKKGAPEDIVFSANHACSVCGFSMPKLEPRMFSFNNPSGACKTCSGLGVRQFFDPAKVIREPTLSLAGGAIPGWDRRNPYYFTMLQSLAEFYEFDVDTPYKELPAEVKKVLLHGSGRVNIRFRYAGLAGRQRMKEHPFEGILNNLDRRYRETESNSVRDDLARFLNTKHCAVCEGSRLRVEARNVFVGDRAIHDVTAMPLNESKDYFDGLDLNPAQMQIADKITREVTQRIGFLINVGLDYLTLNRSADTLSGGESQRIRLASQIGSKLVGVTYILDEPSIGLHPRDNNRLLDTLYMLRDLGNTVIVVEHDEEAIRNADYVIDLGPAAGKHGGEIVASGTPKQIINNKASLTGQYLKGNECIPLPPMRATAQPDKMLGVSKARSNNLKDVSVEFPVGLFTCVTGVSGSGKSTLVNDTLYPAVASALSRTRNTLVECEEVTGIEHIDKIIEIDQNPIGRTPRSNPATYTGMFTAIREMFASTPEARARGYKTGRFSFNVRGGRCEACQGDGMVKVEMHFLPDVYVPCDICQGTRYNRETLDVRYKGKHIHQVLSMTVEEACKFFQAIPSISKKLETLADVGLGYVQLGQSATTLSGGEAQRIKLARELAKRDTGKTLYVLDEPTTGLHFHDVRQLLGVLHSLREKGNTVIVIEHNLDVIKTADWVIDLGPDGGKGGGTVVASGTPEQISKSKKSYTGKYLKPLLKK